MACTNERSAAKETAPKSPDDHVALIIEEDDPRGSTSQPTTDHHQPCIETLLGVSKTMQTDRGEARHMIRRVPKILGENKVNRDCFTPLFIALGPYHRDKEAETYGRGKELKIPLMERLFRYDKSSIMAHFDRVKKVVQEARDCYADQGSTASVPDSEFAVMMFLDGSAILQFISCFVSGHWSGLNIEYYERKLFTHDLFLLENQVPLLVLEELMPGDEIKGMFERFIRDLRPPREVKAPWPLRILEFFDNFCSQKNTKQTGPAQDKDLAAQSPAGAAGGQAQAKELAAHSPAGAAGGQPPPLHILEMLWSHCVPHVPSQKAAKRKEDWYTFRAAKELKVSGIFFSHSRTTNFTDMRYRRLPMTHIAYLCLPPIIVHEHTKTLLLNLASHEMSSSSRGGSYPVCAYICFMDSLIDHTEDVAELRRSGIIRNCLGSDEMVAKLFNDIAEDLVDDRTTFGDLEEDIERHCGSWYTWINQEIGSHFRNPWAFLVFVGALLALGMTFLTTYITVRDFLRENKGGRNKYN